MQVASCKLVYSRKRHGYTMGYLHMIHTATKMTQNLDCLQQKPMLFAAKMVVKWNEKEHEYLHREALQDPLNLNSLRRCGLLKHFCTTNMHAQIKFLEILVRYWVHDQGLFDLHGETIYYYRRHLLHHDFITQRSVDESKWFQLWGGPTQCSILCDYKSLLYKSQVHKSLLYNQKYSHLR